MLRKLTPADVALPIAHPDHAENRIPNSGLRYVDFGGDALATAEIKFDVNARRPHRTSEIAPNAGGQVSLDAKDFLRLTETLRADLQDAAAGPFP